MIFVWTVIEIKNRNIKFIVPGNIFNQVARYSGTRVYVDMCL